MKMVFYISCSDLINGAVISSPFAHFPFRVERYLARDMDDQPPTHPTKLEYFSLPPLRNMSQILHIGLIYA